MIEKILDSVIENAEETIVKGANAAGKAIVNHFVKHGKKYAIGGGTAAIGGVAYAFGESIGHKKGKEEGTAEQAARDEKKMEEMHENHENDRKRWNEEKQAYEDILDEIEKTSNP